MSIISRLFLLFAFPLLLSNTVSAQQDFQGKAYYFSKSTMDLGSWGARMSEAQKKANQRPFKKQIRKNLCVDF